MSENSELKNDIINKIKKNFTEWRELTFFMMHPIFENLIKQFFDHYKSLEGDSLKLEESESTEKRGVCKENDNDNQ